MIVCWECSKDLFACISLKETASSVTELRKEFYVNRIANEAVTNIYFLSVQ